MDNTKIGKLLYSLRKEKQLTQLQLAKLLHVSDRTISKWERGIGCPDVSLLLDLSSIFAIDIEKLLTGEVIINDALGGNMKKIKFYVCPTCGNVSTSFSDIDISCCGKRLIATELQKDNNDLIVKQVENEFFITTKHQMTREHYISFIALLNEDTMIIRKLYPEWDMQVHFPMIRRGIIVWYCNQEGLFYKVIT